jgi:hypothetical protein
VRRIRAAPETVTLTYLVRGSAVAFVTATVLHPGVVRASFGAEDQAAYFAVIRMARPFIKTPAEGAGTLVHLASHPGSTASPAGTSSTASPRPPARLPTTPQPPPGYGRPAPTWPG